MKKLAILIFLTFFNICLGMESEQPFLKQDQKALRRQAFEAITCHNISQLDECLKNGWNINSRGYIYIFPDPTFSTLQVNGQCSILHLICDLPKASEMVQLARWALQNGANPHAQNSNRHTPLDILMNHYPTGEFQKNTLELLKLFKEYKAIFNPGLFESIFRAYFMPETENIRAFKDLAEHTLHYILAQCDVTDINFQCQFKKECSRLFLTNNSKLFRILLQHVSSSNQNDIIQIMSGSSDMQIKALDNDYWNIRFALGILSKKTYISLLPEELRKLLLSYCLNHTMPNASKSSCLSPCSIM